jgi:hypothetical protein
MARTKAMRIAKAKPFLTNAFLIIYPPFSKRWLKVSKMPTFNNSGCKISRKIIASPKFFFTGERNNFSNCLYCQ